MLTPGGNVVYILKQDVFFGGGGAGGGKDGGFGSPGEQGQQRYGRWRRKWRKVRVLKAQEVEEKGGEGWKLRKQSREPGARNRKPFLEAKCVVKEGFTARHVCLPRRA